MKDYLEQIIKFILEHNPYYNGGYMARPSELREVFPDDTKGDHFIMILEDDMRISSRVSARVDMCASPSVVESNTRIVAMIRGADRFAMVENLVNTLQALGVRIASMTIDEEAIIDKLIKGKEERDAAKARVGDYSIVSVNFTTSYIIHPKQLSCITSPCSC